MSPSAATRPDRNAQSHRHTLHPNRHSNCTTTRIRTGVWILHFSVTFFVLLYGIHANGGTTKYIPVSKNAPIDCQRGFVNVRASSSVVEDSLVCCDNMNEEDGRVSSVIPPSLASQTLCRTVTSRRLPLQRRLAKFPDAWLLPIVPLLFRLAYPVVAGISGPGPRLVQIGVQPFRRLVLYMALMLFRGYVLYQGLNALEDLLLEPSSKYDSSCWYEQFVPGCRGRVFDFSDHVVLYYAQLLPIVLFEVLHAFERPYWGKTKAMGVILAVFATYMYVIVCRGAYGTAASFHTRSEILLGYLVSLVVQLPLFVVQCTEVSSQTRSFLFR